MRPRTPFLATLAALALASTSPAPATAAAADTRADFLKLINRPRVPLAAETRATPAPAADLTRLDFTYAADAALPSGVALS